MTPHTLARLTGAASTIATRIVVLDHFRNALASVHLTQDDFERIRRLYESVKSKPGAPVSVPAPLPLPPRLHTF